MKNTNLDWLEDYSLLIFEEIDSTNLEAKRLIKAGINSNYVIWSKLQTEGRGRLSKKWISDPGNLYMTIIYKSNIELDKLSQVSFLTSLAVHDAIKLVAKSKQIPLEIKLKWPNDIMISNAKIGGILIETEISTNSTKPYFLAIGIGVNIQNHPNNIDQDTISLKTYNIEIEPDMLLNNIMHKVRYYIKIWEDGGFLKIREAWLEKAYKIKQVVTIASGNSRISGVFKDIDFSGNIRIMLAGGQICTIPMGEILFEEINTNRFIRKPYLIDPLS